MTCWMGATAEEANALRRNATHAANEDRWLKTDPERPRAVSQGREVACAGQTLAHAFYSSAAMQPVP